MTETISMDFFHQSPDHLYHIYKISGSSLANLPHAHAYYHVCYVSKGSVRHSLGGQTVPLSHGDAFVVPPGVVHSLSFPEAAACEVYSLSFSAGMFHPGFPKSHLYRFLTALQLPGEEAPALRNRVSLTAEQRLSMEALLCCLLREQDADYPLAQSAAASLISAALYLLAQAYAAAPEKNQTLKTAGTYADSVEQCIQYVDRNYHRALTVEGLCRQFALSRTMFSQMFPQLAGMPLKRYVTEKRIQQAAQLAETTGLSLGEIAVSVGYEDFSTFYRNFQKIMGVSPSQYRESRREAAP